MNSIKVPSRLVACALCAGLFLLAQTAPALAGTMADRRLPIAINVPTVINDGTAFPCVISATDIASATFTFLGRSVTAKAAPHKLAASEGINAAVALLPVPLDHPQEQRDIAWTVTFADGSATSGTAPVLITRKKYPVQKLTLKPKYVTPDPALKDRIQREAKMTRAALDTLSPEARWTLPMERPVPGAVTSLFGLRRVLNGKPRGFHRGVDFDGTTGDPIMAIADGRVVLTGDFYYSGRFVIIDHGLGVVSISMHMSEIKAEKGQEVTRGEVIGLIGMTGRSTGPHLHLGLYVLGQGVDALPLLTPGPEPDPSVTANETEKAPVARKKAAGKKRSSTSNRKR